MAKKRVAVVLSGCGNKDGAEITETVSTLIALGESGATYTIFAPEMPFAVTDHVRSQPTGETRNILTEAARIARGRIRNLKELKVDAFDALVFPGGAGVALHLCDFAKAGAGCKVQPDVERVLKEFYSAQKPIGAICIAPALVARVLGKYAITVTLGDDQETIAEIMKTGARHEICAVDDFVTDREHRIVSTPAYMYGNSAPFEVFHGIRKAMAELVEMA